MGVADLVLGTMYFGTVTDDSTSRELLDRFVEAGGRTLDTANCYAFWASVDGSSGQSESVIGRWLAANPGLRPDLEIATKVGVTPVRPGGAQVEGLSARVIEREVTRSLERLEIDSIDLYWAHGEDRGTDLEETVGAFGALVADGRARRLGVSNHPTWRVERARSIAARMGVEPFTALQLTTSYVRPRPGAVVEGKDHRFGFATDETVDLAVQDPKLELWAYSPLIRGSYDRDDRPWPSAYDHPGTTRRLAALDALAAARGITSGQAVLAWLLALRPQWRPIVGVSSLDQLESALRAAEIDLTPEEMASLDVA